MKVSCPSCQTNYNIDDKRIPPGGAKLKCARCQTTFPIRPEGVSAAAPAAPAPSAAAIPLPGASAPSAAAIPLPGAAPSGAIAIPLPGAAPSGAIALGHEAIPLPGAAPQSDGFGYDSGAIPLPGASAPQDDFGYDAGAIPLPGASAPHDDFAFDAGAIPLPGASAPQDDFGYDAGAIPLPGASAPQDDFGYDAGAIPLPGASAPFDSGAIPLPGVASSSGAIPLPGAVDAFSEGFDDVEPPVRQDRDVTRVVAIPMPNAAFREPPRPAAPPPPKAGREFDFSDDSLAPPVDLAHGSVEMPDVTGTARDFDFSDDALPVPAQPEADPFAFDVETPSGEATAFALPPTPNPAHAGYPVEANPFALPPPPAYAEAPMTEDPFALPPPPLEADPFALPPPPAYAQVPMTEDPFALPPPPSGGPSFDFAELPVPAGEDPFSASPPTAGAMDFSDLPSPAAPGMDFSDLPSPAAQPQDLSFDFASPPTPGFNADFGSAPAPVPDFSLDFAEPPPPTAPPASFNPSVDFGDVDFGMPPTPAASPGIPDSLEFDPTARPGDDLEADLSDPLPPPPNAGPADGLEMLSFIDDAASRETGQAGAKVRRFHVRRRSGKVFGPFDEGVVVKMLEDGQLLGNEDVSLDSESWSAIGTIPTFASAIQRLMEGPSKVVAAAPVATASDSEAPRADPGGTQANMRRLEQLYEGRMAAVSVVDRSGADAKIKKRIPLFIAAGVAVLMLGIGVGTEFGTRYGAFGRRAIFPARVSDGSPQAQLVSQARQALLQDTFASYKQAHTLSAQALQEKEYPAVRSLWCQSVYYLQRKYAAADMADMSRCREAMADIALLGEKDVDVIKAAASLALTSRQADAALPPLLDAFSREANQADLELAFLVAEAQAMKRDQNSAIETLKKVLAADPKSAKAHHALGNLHQAAGRADEAAASYAAALEADRKHAASAVELAAVQLLVRKDAEKGTQSVEEALAEDVQSALGPAELARARGLKGVALFHQHKPKEAEAELKSALEKDPQSDFLKAQLAHVMRAQRNYEGALPLYTALASEEGDNLEYADGHITSLVMTGKMQAALEAVQKASGSFPNEARIAYLYGRIEDALDKLSEAEGHYKRAIAADATLVEANLYLGRFYLRQRRNAEARTQLEQAATKAPDLAGVRAGLGELALAENNALLGQQEFERAVQLDPNLADAHLGLSRVALLNNDLEKAQTEANRALELDPHLLKDGRLQRGIVLWRLGKLDEAVAELEKAKAEDPRSTTIPITLGAVLLERGDLPGAESNLGLALSNEPSNHEALYYLALVKAKRMEFTQAMDAMRKAVERAPKRPDYHYAYGVILRDAKNLPDAMREWNTAVDLDPANADAHEALGHAHLENGEFDEAISSFEDSLKSDPRRTRVLGSIGDAYFNAARWNDAIKRYQTALKADAKLTHVYYKVARAFTEQAQHAKAIDWYRKASSVEPENPMTYYYLGFAYKEKNKRREAVQAFKDYLVKKPDATDKKDIEEEIYDLQN
ncbi:tetratricopeptide repeat protein [Myxococcus llanfairpwllgwyngyllgogerychwyrndrobwllllantysiliogogogochensis]|uniref:Tetratricopeptide repeat protein n=1 Tax=Myxococcus llanfairpwllgwyngyllgogerychwyrndrobwllllantysiliogogogochensis TaxID=2590453 RepID=A0A540WPN6_9BACT|nr:tetratricopeptide repeat protein [Myxococcus llanfairpwllgwyngyllgogerychwyrndrobwllllantysiliogogogochensis]TQF10978.1 tetratricopeptide repeat protein [Myxococcus llanfairpwllgwyngyllgogerychwyrndrobwllllantysiliogogogochensis]